MLLGGASRASRLTADIFTKYLKQRRRGRRGAFAFALEHDVVAACGIPDKDTIVMTGGFGHNFVTRYNTRGFVEELPKLPENRWNHACAALPSTEAFVVAGGWGGSSRLSSVYTLLSGGTSWTALASL